MVRLWFESSSDLII